MVWVKILSIIKPPIPILIGLCIGISISLITTPFMMQDEECIPTRLSTDSPWNGDYNGVGAGRKVQDVREDPSDFDYGKLDDYEPRRVTPDLPLHEGNNNPIPSKPKLRPRYVSTELGIREKLFVGILTSRQTIDTLGVAVNKTVTHEVPKLVFFMDTRGQTLPQGMAVVSFSDEKPILRPFHMIKYIGAHYSQAFDYYMFLTDNTYVKGAKLMELVNDISVSHDVHMGAPLNEPSNAYCDFGAGVILSQNMLAKVIDNLDWCMKNAMSDDVSENVGKCFFQATGLPCSSTVHGKKFNHYSSPNFDLDGEARVKEKDQFRRALTVHRVTSDIMMYKLHRFYCQVELNQTKEKIRHAQGVIKSMKPWIPGGPKAITWPVGVAPPITPSNRFDVIRWDYFTSTHIYLDDDFTNVRELTGIHKEDIDFVIKTAIQRLNDKYKDKYDFDKLINGYRRFDPTRGMEYCLDLSLRERASGNQVVKRVSLVRPLSQVEIIPMPYVTESTRINLILPVTAANRDGVVSFLDSYAHTCLDSGDNANLNVVFIYDNPDHKNNKNDIFSVLKSMISYYESKYMNGARINWSAVQSSNPTQLTVMDAISKKFGPEHLFLLCTVGMELSTEFLNRIRMNTIQHWQVFFPIGFWQYKPNLVYEEKPYPTTIEINKNIGHFDNNAFDHASFYNSDFMLARNELSTKGGSLDTDLFDLFLKYHKVHVFRAVEPALLHRYRESVCKPSTDEDAYSRCLVTKAEGLASRSQLAMLIFEHQQKVNQELFDVVQKQKNPNVEQMKPNMKK